MEEGEREFAGNWADMIILTASLFALIFSSFSTVIVSYQPCRRVLGNVFIINKYNL